MLTSSGQLGVNPGDRTLTAGIYIQLFTSFAAYIAVCADGGAWTAIELVIAQAAFCGYLRTAAVLLGFGRVIGETMVVLLCAGNRIAVPDFTAGLGVAFQPVRFRPDRQRSERQHRHHPPPSE